MGLLDLSSRLHSGFAFGALMWIYVPLRKPSIRPFTGAFFIFIEASLTHKATHDFQVHPLMLVVCTFGHLVKGSPRLFLEKSLYSLCR